jgi:hypothetical protein
LYLFQRGERVLALLAVPFAERSGRGDFRIVDVTDPRNPVEIAEWNLRANLGADAFAARGTSAAVYCHSAWASADGLTAYLAYWDAGAVILDISDPASPRYIGRTVYSDGDEGNAHSAWPVAGRPLLLVTDEDFDPRNGWGYLRVYDISTPARPVQVGSFATENARRGAPDGIHSVHNPFMDGETLYLSWYADGVRVVDLSDPANPREVDSYVPPARDDGIAPSIWGVYVDGEYVYLSDLHLGLHVLRRTASAREPAGSRAPRFSRPSRPAPAR